MKEEGVPLSLIVSAALHACALFLFITLSRESAKKASQIISNVDLLIPIHKTSLPTAAAIPKPATPPTTWNFLKLALPSAPKPQELQPLSVKLPERQHLMEAAPKLEDRGHLHSESKLTEKLDMSRRQAPLSAAFNNSIHSHPESSPELPKLEEIGVRRAPKKLQAQIALQEAQASLQSAPLGFNESLSHANHAAPMEEAAPLEEAHHRRAAIEESALPAQTLLPAHPAMGISPESQLPNSLEAPPHRHSPSLALKTAKKKGIEIEGPLANRKTLSYNIPRFPDWAQKDGILEAEVAIRFWVSPEGRVLPNLRIEKTSGFGRLDRLAMESLKKWRFAPIQSEEKEWGVITFRFVLE